MYIIKLSAIFLCLSLLSCQEAALDHTLQAPNIIFIMADDMTTQAISIYENGIYDDIYVSRNKQFSNPEKELKGTVKPVNESNTRWQSRFYWLMKFTFHVLHVENSENVETDDYDLALLGHPSRQYGWVMARTNRIDVDRYQAAMKIFEDRGYDTAKFLKVPQLPEQIGQQGFQ